MQKVFTLKPMVCLRLLAEATVLLLLIAMPVVALWEPRLEQLPLMARLGIYALAIAAAVILPCYGFVSWRVKVDDKGITVISLLKKQIAEWDKLEKLTFKSSWNWRRYVVVFAGGELSFPIWLTNLKELVQLIRENMPQKDGSGGAKGPRIFRQDTIGQVLQVFRVVAGLAFLAVFWFFVGTIHKGNHLISQTDYWLLVAFCLVATVLVVWRCLVIALMPRALEVTDSELVVCTLFFQRRLPWMQVRSLNPSFFLLPEGLMLKTTAGSFLLTEELEAVDELEEAINSHLRPVL